MQCKFCFAKFQDIKNSMLPKGHLSKDQATEVVLQLAQAGFEKITFAGGEPTLCPWLPELIKTAKYAGMTTMVVTNGSILSEEFLKTNRPYLDWIALSIDSLNCNTNIEIGRAIAGKNPLSKTKLYSLVKMINHYEYGLKVNTVVSSKNWNESMDEFIRFAKPKRWKILQVLPIKKQNDKNISEFLISEKQFKAFVDNHRNTSDITCIISELNDEMKGSYAMVDPAGRFFDNSKGIHNYSKPIIEIGSRLAMQQMNWDIVKFEKRGGNYDWKLEGKKMPKKITISGEVASGKSTLGRKLAEKINYSYKSIGNKTRESAEKMGLSIVEFQKKCMTDPELDRKIDIDFSEECNKENNLIIDYRLGYKFIKDAYHVYLKTTEENAIKRLINANRVNETFDTLSERNQTFKAQFKNTYNTDYTDPKHYDLIIDVDSFRTPEEITVYIIDKISNP